MREDAHNPQETGGSREWRGLVGWGIGGGYIFVETGGWRGVMGCRTVRGWTGKEIIYIYIHLFVYITSIEDNISLLL